MTLDENIRQLRDSLTVTSAQALRHETRLKEHQQWLEDNEMAYTRLRIAIGEVVAVQLVTEQKLQRLGDKLEGLIDALRTGRANGHPQP